MGDDYFEKILDDYTDSSCNPNLDFSMTREEREEELREKKAQEQIMAELYEDDMRKEFPNYYNNEYRPSRNPSFMGCLAYLIFQGLILLIILLISQQ